jgi:hypothetical protein
MPNEERGMSGLDLDREPTRRWLLALGVGVTMAATGAITVQG